MAKSHDSPIDTKRFAVRIQPSSEWAVHDVFTGAAAKPSNWPLIDLPLDKAREYYGILNAMDRFHRSYVR